MVLPNLNPDRSPNNFRSQRQSEASMILKKTKHKKGASPNRRNNKFRSFATPQDNYDKHPNLTNLKVENGGRNQAAHKYSSVGATQLPFLQAVRENVNNHSPAIHTSNHILVEQQGEQDQTFYNPKAKVTEQKRDEDDDVVNYEKGRRDSLVSLTDPSIAEPQ